MKKNVAHGFMILATLGTFAFGASVFFLMPTLFAKEPLQEELSKPEAKKNLGKHVVIYLDTMKLELKDNTSVLEVFPIVSKGKPGSYYETPGGTYINDYKIPLHLSSFGNVYLPHSVHIFGNFFIHGIPYYPNGERVSSNYSGGCVRLKDDDMARVYAFIESGTPIIIGYEEKKELDGNFIHQEKMARLMVAVISLEFLPQDDVILFNGEETTRLALLKKLLGGNESVALFYAKTLGNETFIELMNEKARAIGLTETTFTSLGETPKTSGKDLMLFYAYLKNHKSYLLSTSTTAF
ncbi:MAG: hypothetical protein QG653_522 [Patescibacteria group bacterium]|nr:hypothetical protein [Patescibacteria group bacterium]